jgi:2-methylisocitrate lyase-like PEP mutase family enzyme
MSGPVPLRDLQQAGVRRVSLGSALYNRAMGDLRHALTDLAAGNLATATAGLPFRSLSDLVDAAVRD